MADRERNWLERHFWGAAQTVVSIVGLIYTIWARSHPYSQSDRSIAAPGSGAIIRLPLPLTIILVLLFVAFIVPNVMKILRKTPPPRLKIISAYYGVQGGRDQDVAEEYLRPRIGRDALVGWVGADLFGALQPVINLPKRLKVHYSFDGSEATVVKNENELLVLPVDPHAEVLPATPSAVSDEGLLTPLQMDALRLAKSIDTLLEELPVPQKTDFGYSTDRHRPGFATVEEVHVWGNAARVVNEKLRARYALDLQATAKNVHLRFVADGTNNRHLGNLVDTAHNEDELKDLAKTLRLMAFEIETNNET